MHHNLHEVMLLTFVSKNTWGNGARLAVNHLILLFMREVWDVLGAAHGVMVVMDGGHEALIT